MPLIPNFSASQNYLVPSTVLLTDTSTGSDTNIVSRQVFVQDAFGNYLANGTTWALANSTISLAILTQDTACNITVVWLDINNNVLYTLSQTFCFPAYGQQFFYGLIQDQGVQAVTASNGVQQDTNYDTNLALFWTYITGAMNAIILNSDVSGSQNLLNAEIEMQNNQAKYF